LSSAIVACGDPRVRVLGEPDVPAHAPLAVGLRHAAACAHGRHLVYLPGPVIIDGVDRLIARLEALRSHEASTPVVHAIDAAADDAAQRGLTVISRRALDRLDGVDALAVDPIGEVGTRARRTFETRVVHGVHVRTLPSIDAELDLTVDRAWSALGDGGLVPAAIVADLNRRGERLTEHLVTRLARELPADGGAVAVFGAGPLTPFVVAAVRASGRRLAGLFADADLGVGSAGLAVRPVSELATIEACWIMAACASPADARVLHGLVPAARVMHVVEPASIRPAVPPFATYAVPDGLAHARERRAGGALLEAEAAYRAVLRDPSFAAAPVARYELALVHDALGREHDAEVGLRWAWRHYPAERATIAYNLGSVYERQGRWRQASRAFAQALRLTPAHDLARVGGCHFHLGEIALAEGDDVRAREHFERALAALPAHGKARARLDALQMV
jgi:hypothetical protein